MLFPIVVSTILKESVFNADQAITSNSQFVIPITEDAQDTSKIFAFNVWIDISSLKIDVYLIVFQFLMRGQFFIINQLLMPTLKAHWKSIMEKQFRTFMDTLFPLCTLE